MSKKKSPIANVEVHGARQNNLKEIDVTIPRDALVVFSGVSGSGKSSLAFGTIYAEAQRRYFESIAPYARRLIDQVGVPDVDAIHGLPPAVALQQQRGIGNVRSSVGSVTTLSNLIRMMYSRAGMYPADQPALYAEDFSPNTPQGACPACHGLGHIYDITESLMVPDPSLSIREKAIASWPPAWHGQNLRDILVTLGYNIDAPWKTLPPQARRWILFTDETPTVPVYPGLTPQETRDAIRKKQTPGYMGTFTSARNYVLHTFANTKSASIKKRISRFMEGKLCPVCHGKKLKAESLTVTFAGLDIGEFLQLPIDQLVSLLLPITRGNFSAHTDGAVVDNVFTSRIKGERAPSRPSELAPDVGRMPAMSAEKQLAAQRLAKAVMDKLLQLQKLGLGYLTLDRATPTLSAGEYQRLRLATQLSAILFGVVYILDEPSAGLHPSDRHALYDALENLRNAGNSVFVVEHDLELMRRAQWLVDVGPLAGEQGGHVIYSGVPEGLKGIKESQTAHYLFNHLPPIRSYGRPPSGWLKLRAIRRHNIQGVDVDIPLHSLTAVTGISGSGKSSLFAQALPELVQAFLGQEPEMADDTDAPDFNGKTYGTLDGEKAAIERLVMVNQKPIGRTPRSNLATYTGLFDHIRKLFATVPESKRRGYDAGQFSFNVAKGRCKTCDGEGFVSVELLFMPSVYTPCPTCHGARYNEETLQVRWQNKNIAEVLHMTVDEARDFFTDEELIARPLRLLTEIGLGYLRLGQPATELSGGEAQRIKLVTELQRSQRGHTLYILDEPTTGLHAADADRLMVHLQRLVNTGNTAIVIEHDIRTVVQADWIIDIGPGAGQEGGRLVAAGTPEQVAQVSTSRTAPFIANMLSI
ncbi:excinuclease ABC subunit UvrA [Serratia ureilytica]|uniref:excinuclease ABC subunit A n=1 Tax=Serratia ureilytica TaxID=300181 RepID=UPI00384B3296